MHLPRFVAAVSALLLLGACTNTYHGVHDDYKDYERWAHNEPSRLNDTFGKIPRGYGGQNSVGAALLKPDGMGKVGAAKYNWHEGAGEVGPGTPVFERQQQQSYEANDSVTVYPLDGGTDYAGPVTNSGGTMEQQIFFRHGSSHITPGERRDIGRVADSVRESATGVTVVGHASTRVNGTTDPMRRKEINYNMGQKRADAVSGVLTDAGVDPGLVTSVSKGDDEANPNPGSRNQEAADRRVEIYTNR